MHACLVALLCSLNVFFQPKVRKVTDGSAMAGKQLHISGQHGFDCMLGCQPATHQNYYFRRLEENCPMSMGRERCREWSRHCVRVGVMSDGDKLRGGVISVLLKKCPSSFGPLVPLLRKTIFASSGKTLSRRHQCGWSWIHTRTHRKQCMLVFGFNCYCTWVLIIKIS